MDRKVKRAWFVGALALGLSAMIPQDASAQLFRGRRGSARHCSPARHSPTVEQGACYGQSNMAYGSGAYAGNQPSTCCGTTSNSGISSPQVYGATPQDSQERNDAAGNRIGAGTRTGQDRFDSQGNRISEGTQWSSQQRNGTQGNLIDDQNQLNGQRRLDGSGSRNTIGNQLNDQKPVAPQVKSTVRDINSDTGLDLPKTIADPIGAPASTGEATIPPAPRDR